MPAKNCLECVYCGSSEDLTVEHAPPKLIFPEPRPSDLITVKACKSCNESGSKDAEYFRIFLCMHPLVTKLSTIRALKPVAERSFLRTEAAGLHQSYLDSVEPFCEGKTAFMPDMTRVHEVVKRTAICLYAFETGVRLPDTHGVKVISMESMTLWDRESVTAFKSRILPPLSEPPLRTFAAGLFAYSFLHEEETGAKVCGMMFHGRLPFAAMFANEERIKAKRAAKKT